MTSASHLQGSLRAEAFLMGQRPGPQAVPVYRLSFDTPQPDAASHESARIVN